MVGVTFEVCPLRCRSFVEVCVVVEVVGVISLVEASVFVAFVICSFKTFLLVTFS